MPKHNQLIAILSVLALSVVARADNTDWVSLFDGEACGGWMTPADRRTPRKVFKDEEWNHYRIVAEGTRIQTWINGEPVEDLVDEEKSKTHPKGFIGLQVHGVGDRGPFQVAWRNIRIKVLDKD